MKLNRVKRATRSYMRDRAHQATGTATSYAVAAGFYAAAGIFVLAAFLVGLDALFRFIEIKYGLFWAFGAIGLILVLLAAVCAGLAMAKLKHPTPEIPSLASRLRVALASPVLGGAEPDEPDPDTIPLSRSTPFRAAAPSRYGKNAISVPVGLGVAALVLGWAAARRRQRGRRERDEA
jgi:hypothetical protein